MQKLSETPVELETGPKVAKTTRICNFPSKLLKFALLGQKNAKRSVARFFSEKEVRAGCVHLRAPACDLRATCVRPACTCVHLRATLFWQNLAAPLTLFPVFGKIALFSRISLDLCLFGHFSCVFVAFSYFLNKNGIFLAVLGFLVRNCLLATFSTRFDQNPIIFWKTQAGGWNSQAQKVFACISWWVSNSTLFFLLRGQTFTLKASNQPICVETGADRPRHLIHLFPKFTPTRMAGFCAVREKGCASCKELVDTCHFSALSCNLPSQCHVGGCVYTKSGESENGNWNNYFPRSSQTNDRSPHTQHTESLFFSFCVFSLVFGSEPALFWTDHPTQHFFRTVEKTQQAEQHL